MIRSKGTFAKMKKTVSGKTNKTAPADREDLGLEVLPSSSLFGDVRTPGPAIQSPPPFGAAEIEESLDEFKIDSVEESLESQEPEEAEPEQEFEDDYAVYPHDITWEYLKGLEKISLLTPEKEVELAKKIKEGERQVKVFETKSFA